MKRMALLGVIALAPVLGACTDADGARRTAEAHGFTDVAITGYRWTGCSRDDETHTGFEATNQRGDRVSGVVCGSWSLFGKSNTLRID